MFWKMSFCSVFLLHIHDSQVSKFNPIWWSETTGICSLKRCSLWQWRLCDHNSRVDYLLMLHPIARLVPCISVTEVKSIWCLHMCDPSCSACFSQNVQNISVLPQGTSPPKPPRAHELKLLVKNITVNLTDHSAAGNVAHVLLLIFKQFFFFLLDEIIWKLWVTAFSQKEM